MRAGWKIGAAAAGTTALAISGYALTQPGGDGGPRDAAPGPDRTAGPDRTTRPTGEPAPPADAKLASERKYTFKRLSGPARTVVYREGRKVVATFTDGARTVALPGPKRVFREPSTTDATVTSRTWVRFAPRPWRKGAEKAPGFDKWLERARDFDEPDLLAIAMQYVPGSPEIRDDNGLRIAHDAGFGPKEDGDRQEGSDFYDYLGIDWTTPKGSKLEADPDRKGYLDCTGYLRLVVGYRSGYPLENTVPSGAKLPRRAALMQKHAPGVRLMRARGGPVEDVSRLQPGDLLGFNASENDRPNRAHMGIYLGIDSEGSPRFVSSRKVANGPTMGDEGGRAVIDDPDRGHYTKAFRMALRL